MTEPGVLRLAGHAGPPAALPSVPPLLAAAPLSPALAAELKQMRLMQMRLQLRESVLCRQVYTPGPPRLLIRVTEASVVRRFCLSTTPLGRLRRARAFTPQSVCLLGVK